MGRIAVYYSACSTLISSLRKCRNQLKEESNCASKALRKLGQISESYYELNKIYDNLNSIRSKSDSDIVKMENFEKRLKKYVEMVKKSDNDICNII
ncbi:MAG: hypothetical protein GX981_07145 [Tissierellia bacterium]|nr:hypothetical protein [Tissierellia bacterium]